MDVSVGAVRPLIAAPFFVRDVRATSAQRAALVDVLLDGRLVRAARRARRGSALA